MITLGLRELLQQETAQQAAQQAAAQKARWEYRTQAYRCPTCGVRVQSVDGQMVTCTCGKIGVGGSVFAETTFGMPVDRPYAYAEER